MQGRDLILRNIFEKYEELSNSNISAIPEPERTLICIYSAHGIIGNGGFRYFFENNFQDDNQEAIKHIIESYHNIGLSYHAEGIKEMLDLFPNSKPHENLKERAKFLSIYFDNENKSYLTKIDEVENLFFSNFEKAFDYAYKYYTKHCFK